jgi:hypothetical protein
MKKILLSILFVFYLFPANAYTFSGNCVQYDIYEYFLIAKFDMKLYSWAVTENGTKTIWLFVNEQKHFATITVGLNGCSTLMMPEDQLSFFKRKESSIPGHVLPFSFGENL